MRTDISSMTFESKAFVVTMVGTLMQFFGNVSFMQVVGFVVAIAGLVAQISAYLRNRAETKNAEEERQIRREADKREAELHEARMHFMRRDIVRAEDDNGKPLA